MQKSLGALGFIVTLMGISGAVDHLWRQPIMGWALNLLHREVFTQVEWIADHALFANLVVAGVGVVVMVLSERLRSDT